MKIKLFKFLKDESGAAIVEYGMALLVVGAIAAGAFTYLGNQTSENVKGACDAIGNADCSTLVTR